MNFSKSTRYSNTFKLIEYGAEWERYLVDDESENDLFGPLTPKFQSLTKPIVEFIAKICKEFKFHPEIEFTIYNTMDAFFVKYFIALRKDIKNLRDPAEASKKWKSMLSQTKEDISIEIFCISMICAKYVDSYTPIPLQRMLATLQKAGCQVNIDELKQTEFKVFKLLEFQIAKPIAFHIIHFITQKIYKADNTQYRTFLETCVLVLRFIYLEREHIFQSLKSKNKFDLTNLEANERFLAGGAILCSTSLIKIEGNGHEGIVDILFNFFKLPKDNVLHFSEVLCSLIINE